MASQQKKMTKMSEKQEEQVQLQKAAQSLDYEQ